jgi:bifunctional non-homologous end joining protein LigD
MDHHPELSAESTTPDSREGSGPGPTEGLEIYRGRRNFGRTPEPAGAAHDDPAAGERFVVQKHAARRLHYDFRLEHDGVLESWAVPKGPDLRPGQKRLAVRVENHPLEYGDFEGVIPRGEYGAGTVMLWDRGRYRAERRDKDRLDFVLEGQKLRGAWSLVRMGGRAAEEGDNWLLIKRRDPAARRIDDDESGQAQATAPDTSVATGRTMEQIAADGDRTWTSADGEIDAAAPTPDPTREPIPDPTKIVGARARPLPSDPRPLLPTLTDKVPSGERWVHEIKFDGYRILGRIENGKTRLISRNGEDWTHRFPEIAALLDGLPVRDALLDGEIVALGKDGVSRFRGLQEALARGSTANLTYQLFDLLYLDGLDLAGADLGARKEALARLLRAVGLIGSARVRYTDHLVGQGPAFLEQACRLGLEGIISKRADEPYREGRSTRWLKVKCMRHEELVIGGYTDPGGSRLGFGALLLGAYRDDDLIYVGRVGTGFSNRQLESLHRVLRQIEIPRSPFETPPAAVGLHWVRPDLVAEVEFTEWTAAGLLRHPAFRGLREDRDPGEIRLPAGARSGSPVAGSASSGAARRRLRVAVAGVTISHPERVIYPRQGVTKLALAHYYEDIADWILPHLSERPLSILRCPQGLEQECFFQKHPGQAMPRTIPRIEIAEKSGPKPYLFVRRARDLVELVQNGTLELHVWGSRVTDVERPDLLVLDLDPAPDVSWSRVLRAAFALRERLAALGLESFVRTTGGKGLHLVTPLIPTLGWDEVKAFARAIAEAHAHDDPRRFTADMSKSKRQGRIFIDYLRNGRGSTAIASYSTRAREGATVAVPLSWDELSPAVTSDRFDIENLRRRLDSLPADPWDGFEAARRAITPQMRAAVAAPAGGRSS